MIQVCDTELPNDHKSIHDTKTLWEVQRMRSKWTSQSAATARIPKKAGGRRLRRSDFNPVAWVFVSHGIQQNLHYTLDFSFELRDEFPNFSSLVLDLALPPVFPRVCIIPRRAFRFKLSPNQEEAHLQMMRKLAEDTSNMYVLPDENQLACRVSWSQFSRWVSSSMQVQNCLSFSCFNSSPGDLEKIRSRTQAPDEKMVEKELWAEGVLHIGTLFWAQRC